MDLRDDGGVALAFDLVGALSRLLIPAARPPQRADRLWRHTCLEAFVMAADGPGYHEHNFSPSGEWAAYAFRGYRTPGGPDITPNPEIAVRVAEDRLELSAVLGASCLPRVAPGMWLRLGLCAVIEDTDGVLSYWALRHPPGVPDFHHVDTFVLNLDWSSF